MNVISSYEVYKDVIEPYKKDCKYTNVYFMKAQIQGMVARKKLYYMEQEGNLFLFEQEAGFYRVFYYVRDDSADKNISLPEPGVIEFVYKNKEGIKKRKEIQFIERLGFALGRHSCRMVLESNRVSDEPIKPGAVGAVMRYAKSTDTEKINCLLHKEFNPLYSYLPDKDDLMKMISQNQVLIAEVGGETVGLLHFESVHASIQLWQIAIEDKYKGMGIGSMLLAEWHRLYHNKVDSFLLWVDMDNEPAQKMYQSAGYRQDGRFADEYILGGTTKYI